MVNPSSSPNHRQEFRNPPDIYHRAKHHRTTVERESRILRQLPMIDAQWIEFLAIATLLYILVMLIR